MRGDHHDSVKHDPPSLPFGNIERPSLLHVLSQSLSSRLVVITAPQGYGKTTLLSQLVSHWEDLHPSPRTALAWYSLGPSDDDAAVFVEGLVFAVRRSTPSVGRSTLAILRGLQDPRLQMSRLLGVLTQEIREAGLERVVLVLDDFHVLTEKAVLDALEQVVKDPSSPLCLLLSTEKETSWYLAQLRAARSLLEVRESQLLFNGKDLEALLHLRLGATPATSMIDHLAKETRGWPSAAALAASIVALTGRPLPVSRLAPTEHGYGRLVKELLRALSPRLRDALVRSALPDRVESTTLAVSGATSVTELLSTLERIALPAARVAQGSETLRYDSVFRSALERELEASVSPQELKSLRTAIASNHAAEGRFDLAVRGYLQAGMYDELAAFLDGAVPIELSRGHLDTVLRWLRSAPGHTRKAYPRLMIHEARALLRRGLLPEARALLVAAEPRLHSPEDSLGLVQREVSWCDLLLAERRFTEAARTAEATLLRLPENEHLERANLHWILAQAREMLGSLAPAFEASSEGLLAAERAGRRDLVVRALLQLGRLAELRGEFTAAVAIAARSVHTGISLQTEDLALPVAGGLAASVYMERNLVDQAAAVASIAQGAAERLCDPAAGLRAALVSAQVAEILGGPSLDSPVSKILGSEPSVDGVLARQAAAASLLRSGKKGEAAEWARQALEDAERLGHRPSIQRSRFLIESGRSGVLGLRLLRQARQLRAAFSSIGDRRWLSAASRLAAMTHQRLGIGWRARANLKASLEAARDEGYVGMPLGLPGRSDRLFVLAVRNGIYPEFAGTLLGVETDAGRRLLQPLLADKNPAVRSRAEQAAKGLQLGLGRASMPRLAWPGAGDDPRAPVVALQSLGGMEAFVDSEQVGWPSPDARTLAAYFVVKRDAPVHREQLLADVWPDCASHQAHTRLHVALYQLRETLGAGYPAVDPEAEREGYYLWDGSGCFIDAENFRALSTEIETSVAQQQAPVLDEVTVRLLEQAVALYGGEFLSDLTVSWCAEQREDLRSRLLRLTRLSMDHYIARRQWTDAIRHGIKSLRSDPLQEDVVRDLMVAYFHIGDRASVLSQYREIKRLLARERSAWPSDETRQLRIRLLGK